MLSYVVAFAPDTTGVVDLPKPIVLLFDIRQEDLQALILPQKGAVPRVLESPPRLYDALHHPATKPNGNTDDADHGQDQYAKTEHLFHKQTASKGPFLLSTRVPARAVPI